MRSSKILGVILVLTLFLNLVNAGSFGVDMSSTDSSNGNSYGVKMDPEDRIAFNNNSGSVNYSKYADFWDGLDTPKNISIFDLGEVNPFNQTLNTTSNVTFDFVGLGGSPSATSRLYMYGQPSKTTALAVFQASSNPASSRASFQLGDWFMGQDSGANNVQDFYIYDNAHGGYYTMITNITGNFDLPKGTLTLGSDVMLRDSGTNELTIGGQTLIQNSMSVRKVAGSSAVLGCVNRNGWTGAIFDNTKMALCITEQNSLDAIRFEVYNGGGSAVDVNTLYIDNAGKVGFGNTPLTNFYVESNSMFDSTVGIDTASPMTDLEINSSSLTSNPLLVRGAIAGVNVSIERRSGVAGASPVLNINYRNITSGVGYSQGGIGSYFATSNGLGYLYFSANKSWAFTGNNNMYLYPDFSTVFGGDVKISPASGVGKLQFITQNANALIDFIDVSTTEWHMGRVESTNTFIITETGVADHLTINPGGQVDLSNNLTVDKNLDVTGNITGNFYYGAMYVNLSNSSTVEFATQNLWVQVRNFTLDESNGFTLYNFANLSSDLGSVYKVDGAVSFTGGSGSTHAFAIGVNGVPHYPTYIRRKLGSTDAGALALTGIITINKGDNISLLSRDEDVALNNIEIISANLNVVRVGN